jgi:CBS domain-containing protein
MKHVRAVADVMTHAVISVNSSAPFKEIVEAMRQWHVSALPVLSATGHVVGVVSEGDLIIKAQGEDASHAVTAGRLMTTPAVTVQPDTTIAGAARLMARRHLKRLPVVDAEERLLGVVSRGDLLKIYLRSDADIAEEVRSELIAHLIPAKASALDVRVKDGAVTLTGAVPVSTLIDVLVRLARAVPGVVDVDAQLDVRHPVL